MLFGFSVFILIAFTLIIFANELNSFLTRVSMPLMKRPYLKHGILLIVFTGILVVYKPYKDLTFDYIIICYQHVLNYIAHFFGSDKLAVQLSRTITLLIFSVVPTLLLSFMSWLIKGRTLRNVYHYIWISWVIMIALIHEFATPQFPTPHL